MGIAELKTYQRLVFLSFLTFCFFFVWVPGGRLGAQENILASYHQNFIRASLSAKTSVLIDAAMDDRANEFIGELYEIALQYALANGHVLRDDPEMISLVTVAARGAGRAGNTDSVTSLWGLFRTFYDPHPRVEILGALSVLGRGNPWVITNLNRFLDEKNRAFRAGQNIAHAFPVLRACINALGTLGDESSFPYLFSAMTAGYPQVIVQDALRALDSLEAHFTDYLLGIIRNNPFPEKAVAFRIGAYNERLSISERAAISMTALEVSLNAHTQIANSLRYDAVVVLTRLRWAAAAPLVIRNFHRVQADFLNGVAPRERLLEAIFCLAVMESPEAAQALTLQLSLINSRKENTGEFDEEITLAIINALGELGNQVAFDHLLYISFLNYPDRIQASAREALNRLRW